MPKCFFNYKLFPDNEIDLFEKDHSIFEIDHNHRIFNPLKYVETPIDIYGNIPIVEITAPNGTWSLPSSGDFREELEDMYLSHFTNIMEYKGYVTYYKDEE